MHEGKRTRITIALAVVIAISNPVFAYGEGVRMPEHISPFVSGVAGARQNGVSDTDRSDVRIPLDHDASKAANFIDGIKGIRTVQKAEVLLIPPGMESPILLTERGLRKAGCTFGTRDPLRIADLINLLQHANVRTKPAVGRPGGGGSEGIFLTLANGDEISFWFGFPTDIHYYPDYAGSPVGGSFYAPRGHGQYLVADSSLPQGLYQWAEKTGGAAPDRLDCRGLMKKIEELFKSTQPR